MIRESSLMIEHSAGSIAAPTPRTRISEPAAGCSALLADFGKLRLKGTWRFLKGIKIRCHIKFGGSALISHFVLFPRVRPVGLSAVSPGRMESAVGGSC